jgi:hypothetical protein
LQKEGRRENMFPIRTIDLLDRAEAERILALKHQVAGLSDGFTLEFSDGGVVFALATETKRSVVSVMPSRYYGQMALAL